MLRKLRLKFVCTNMLIVTIMLCIIFGMVLNFTRNNLEQQSIQMMQELATDPLRVFQPGDVSPSIRLPYFLLQVGDRGEVLSTGGGYFDLSNQQLLKYLIESSVAAKTKIGVIPEYNLRYCRVVTPLTQYVVFADITNEINTMENLMRNCLLIGILAFLAFLVISILLARWAVRPVEKAWNQQKQFVADASHELKSPLTVITTNGELLQMKDCSADERMECSSSILTMAQQMRGLVDRLLRMAQIDGAAEKIKLVKLNLSKLIDQASLPFEAVLFENQLVLDSEIEKGIEMHGDEDALRQVIEILLDNAKKYATSGTSVKLELKRNKQRRCLLTVSTEGETISKQDLSRIFDRFYRVDKAREMNQSYGLGLSIAREIVQMHKGKIWAESVNGTNTFFVQLPCSCGK